MKNIFFEINVKPYTMSEFVELIDKKINNREQAHVLGINAEKIVDIQKNDNLKRIIRESDVIHADGISIVWASILLKKKLPQRVAGIDLMEKLLNLAEVKKYTIYFLGAKSTVLEEMMIKLRIKYPKLRIVGSRNGYFSENDWPEILKGINRVKPQIIFVGITSPKKEYIIDYLLKNNVEAVLMGVGGSFDVLSGKIKRAPYWMQKSGLEWLFRLIQEPNRLLKRYLIGNFQFAILLLKEMTYRYMK